MTAAQFTFVIGFLVVSLAILLVMLRMYVRARQLDGGGQARLATVVGLGPRLEFTETNRWASYLHRATGVAVALFLVLHLFDVALVVWSAPVYEQVHQLYETPVMRVFECGLLFALIFHTLNGLRLLVLDILDIGMRGALRLLQGVSVVTVLITIAGSGVILWPIVQ